MSAVPVSHQLKIDKEAFSQSLADEIGPLAQKLWDECSEIKKDTCSFHGERGFKIEPDIPRYLALKDSILVLTLRDDSGELKGYSLSVYYMSLHHAPVLCANVDSFYIEPDYRFHVGILIAKMEEEFRSRGVVVVGWPTTPDSAMFSVLKRLGYAPDDVIMEKRICAW